ncbi:MAG: glycoside hydrolase family 3 protein, partial [Ruminococcus sp.]|nr:glycoside hydrolase family 3 protein [Ruminococcus sp.]
MKKRILSLILVVLFVSLSAAVVPASATESTAEQYLVSMSTEDKISMMIMPAFRWKTDSEGNRTNVTEITDDITETLQKHSYAGVILFSQNTETNAGTTRFVDALQKANAAGGDRPQLLISTDQEGGNVTRLTQGTMTPGNMALGAINDVNITKEIAALMGKEMTAVGINADFAPDVDVNNNPANPVIGVRAFSDDAQTVAQHGSAFVEALNGTGVISTLKHFPGHGDTSTDSHTGLPSIDKTYEQLKQNELIPFQACISAGAQMIMTAHIVYPQIETETYVSKLTGDTINLPATLSKTIITDILRGDMGFDGVVATDAMEMDAIAKHFDKYDAARLAIDAGVDILLMPVEMRSKDGFAEMDRYITTLAQQADNGAISIEKINAAVLRILKLKESNGLFGKYDGSDIESRVQNAVDTVGIKASHDREWEITKKAITLVKNDDNTLPLTTPGQKTVVLVPYDDETIPMQYAVKRLAADGKLPEGAVVEAYSYRNKTPADVLPMIEGADNVVFMSEIYGAAALKNDLAKAADLLADTVHQRGGKFIVMSVSLPYDAARFQKADAIMIAY